MVRTSSDEKPRRGDMDLFSLEMKSQFVRVNSSRQLANATYSSSQTINRSQLESRLRVIDFLKDQLYPTGNEELLSSRRSNSLLSH